MMTKDILISDFTDPCFMNAFILYFKEWDMQIKDWDGLFREMNESDENRAWLRMDADGQVIGFIQFTPLTMSSWFFEEKWGFIREFWVKKSFRRHGHGAALLALAEQYFRDLGIQKLVLTTDTAPDYYRARGYEKDDAITARNNDDVFVKQIQ